MHLIPWGWVFNRWTPILLVIYGVIWGGSWPATACWVAILVAAWGRHFYLERRYRELDYLGPTYIPSTPAAPAARQATSAAPAPKFDARTGKPIAPKFDVYTGAPLPKFDPYTGAPLHPPLTPPDETADPGS